MKFLLMVPDEPRTELRMRIREIAQARVRYGYRKIRVLLNREGWDVGKYLVYRLYTEEGLSLKRMKPAGKRKAARSRAERLKATGPDQAWSMDFVADQLQEGSRFRALTIVDVYTREALVIEAGQGLKGDDVVRTLNKLKFERGVPKVLFCDNGSEFTSQAMDLWAYRNEVKSTTRVQVSQPTMPSWRASMGLSGPNA
jgi:putative transposase